MSLKLPLAAGQVLGSVLEKSQRPRAPLRNRTVDLLLTMNPHQVPSPQVNRADLAEHNPAQALTSPKKALPSPVLPLTLPLILILFQRADDHRDHPSKMRAVERRRPTPST